ALPDWDRRVELDSGLSREWVLLQRARVYALLNDHARAAAGAEAVVKRVAKDGELQHDAACVLALASSAAGRDGKLPAAERRRLDEQHAARSVELLSRASEAGYYRKAEGRGRLRADKDLDG